MEWISVDKELPAREDPVLAASAGRRGNCSIVYAAMYMDGTTWANLESVDVNGDYGYLYNVTHWMAYPLPPIPRQPAPAQPAAPQEVEA